MYGGSKGSARPMASRFRRRRCSSRSSIPLSRPSSPARIASRIFTTTWPRSERRSRQACGRISCRKACCGRTRRRARGDMRWSPQYERLPVYGTEHAIATSHPTASAVGLQVLATGGNAVDAALAAHAVLCVVEPGMTGVGGDCFALYYDARSRKIVGINGSGYAPAERPATLTPAMFGPTSPHAVTIPGAVDAWCRLSAAYGTRPLDELFAPAMRLAGDGTPLHPRGARGSGGEGPPRAPPAG